MDSYIQRVHFSVLSEEEIRRLAVVRCHDPGLYKNGLPVIGSVVDARLGSVNRKIVCGTCKNAFGFSCPGHTGLIDLAVPLWNPAFIETVLRILRSVCFYCSRILSDDAEVDGGEGNTCTKRRRLAQVSMQSKTIKACPHCHGPQPTYTKVQHSVACSFDGIPLDRFESPEEVDFVNQPFTAGTALSILRNIPDDDCARLGFDVGPRRTHPKSLIMTVLLVPSNTIRPSVSPDDNGKQLGHDDITRMLQDILKKSQGIEKVLRETPGADLGPRVAELQASLNQYLMNDAKTATGAPQGGKRKRSVVGDGNGAVVTSVDRDKAMRLTITRGVAQRLNGKQGRLRQNLTGKRTDFSSRAVISPDPFLDLDELGVPEIVARRQTIPEVVSDRNRAYLMGLIRARRVNYVRPPDLVRSAAPPVLFNIAVLKDEQVEDMIRTKVEVGWIVERQLQDGDIVLFNRQPSLHAFSLMAHRVKVLRGRHTFALNPQCTHPYNADFDGDEMNMHVLQTVHARAEAQELMAVGKNILSAQNYAPSLGMIQDAIMGLWLLTADDTVLDRALACQMCMAPRTPVGLPGPGPWTGKAIFSTLLPETLNLHRGDLEVRGGMLVRGRLNKKHLGGGPGGFIDVLARDYGPEAAVRFVSDAQRLAVLYLRVRGASAGYRDMIIAPDLHAQIVARMERTREWSSEGGDGEDQVMAQLRGAINEVGAMAVDQALPENGLLRMIECGSKGSKINFAQITAAVGVQMVGGARIFATGDRSRRTLPCFPDGDHSPQAHGLVQSSYRDGIGPAELFFHVKAGREGLVDTAVKTAETGKMSRHVTKFLESTVSTERGRIINTARELIQPFYGGDGFDGARVELVTVPLDDTSPWGLDAIARLRTNQARFGVTPKAYPMPLHVGRLVDDHPDPSILWEPHFDALVRRLVPPDQILEGPHGLHTCLDPFRLHLRRHPISQGLWDRIVDRTYRAMLPAGYPPGIIAAQSSSQLVTQNCLNTFHSTGQAHDLVNSGVPRFMELLNNTTDIATPRMAFPSDDPMHDLPYRLLCHCVVHTETMRDADGAVHRYTLRRPEDAVGTMVSMVPSSVARGVRRYFRGHPVRVRATPFGAPIWSITVSYGMDPPEHLSQRVILHGIRGVGGVGHADGMVVCAGVNLVDLWWALPDRTRPRVETNSVVAVHEALGIEAAMVALYREGAAVIGEENISHRHLCLLVDAMTRSGTIHAVNRHGLSHTTATPLQRASFEEALDVLVEAAVYNSESSVAGVTESVILGAPTRIGTGSVVLQDERQAVPTPKEYEAKPSLALLENHQVYTFVGRRRTNLIAGRDTAPILAPGHTLVVHAPNMDARPSARVRVVFQCRGGFGVQVQQTGAWRTVYDVRDEPKAASREWFVTATRVGLVTVTLEINHRAVFVTIQGLQQSHDLSRSPHHVEDMKELIRDRRVRIHCDETLLDHHGRPETLQTKRVLVEGFLRQKPGKRKGA
jgi:DNA-directed RNA polymerase beta' subunit